MGGGARNLSEMNAEKEISTERRGASIDELARRMVSIENTDDDVAKMIAANWQNIFWGMVIIAIGLFVFENFRQTRIKKSGEVAGIFADAQSSFKKSAESGAAENGAGVNESLKLLTTTYSDDIYGKFAHLYQSTLLQQQKKFDEAKQSIPSSFNLPIQALFNTPRAKPSREVAANDIVIELAALQTLRLAIDEGKEPIGDIRRKLKGLAFGSRFVTVEAVLALYRISETETEKSEARDVGSEIANARTSLKGEIERQLSSEDIVLPLGDSLKVQTVTK